MSKITTTSRRRVLYHPSVLSKSFHTYRHIMQRVLCFLHFQPRRFIVSRLIRCAHYIQKFALGSSAWLEERPSSIPTLLPPLDLARKPAKNRLIAFCSIVCIGDVVRTARAANIGSSRDAEHYI